MTGVFISFEGVDGVGKTTQVERLRAYVESLGRTAVVTREPGGTPLGVAIRRMLLHGVQADADAGTGNTVGSAAAPDGAAAPAAGSAKDAAAGSADIAPRAEALLFAADRAQHVAEVVRPALDRGDVVITDRYLDSSLAYQAGGRELTPAEIRDLSMWATAGLLPARTYLLDMDPAASHARLTHGEDRMESAGDDFQARTRRAFLDLAAAEPDRFRVIDAAQPVEDVWAAIRADFDALLGEARSEVRSEVRP
ncbi:dTMP kinase [Bifidobacterium avesanii]|uniref:Thymidylate kinase n=1 Tax=Bifidobacterium avesanii TaxID=1798157 RepID=A0A7K3TF65_9BIFI|nr:dTMP kinase [Bifidobacterium avesanii]KAB8294431.1 thymidylate kinase [Bifidobacterium avesanii]NEG77737.1 dTMP kinase [Bifidobacterium avesanii]